MAGKSVKKATPVAVEKSSKHHVSQIQGVQISMQSSNDMPSYYVNHIEVSRTAHEFAITAAQIPPRLSVDQIATVTNDKKLVIEPNIQLVMPLGMLSDLITILNMQKEGVQ